MKNTHFLVPAHDLKLLASGYNEKMLLMPPFNVPYFMSMGGLKSSAADMIKYIELQLDKTNKIAGLTQFRTLNLDAQTGNAINLLPGDKITSAIYSVGLNWFLYQYDNGHTQIWTDGSTSGFCSYIIFYPEINSGMILLANKTDEKIFRKLPGVAYDIFTALEAKNYK
jgi:CubicO group peptidase (beta-lactamase class C family)